MLSSIHERTRIEKKDGGAAYTEDDGANWHELALDATVSMNLWGFTGSILPELQAHFAAFLQENLPKNPLKCEYFLPTVLDEHISQQKAPAKVLTSADRWYGVTYN